MDANNPSQDSDFMIAIAQLRQPQGFAPVAEDSMKLGNVAEYIRVLSGFCTLGRVNQDRLALRTIAQFQIGSSDRPEVAP
jgi:hypothetical protein